MSYPLRPSTSSRHAALSHRLIAKQQARFGPSASHQKSKSQKNVGEIIPNDMYWTWLLKAVKVTIGHSELPLLPLLTKLDRFIVHRTGVSLELVKEPLGNWQVWSKSPLVDIERTMGGFTRWQTG